MGGGHESGLQLILQHEITAGGARGREEGDRDRVEGEHCQSEPRKKGICISNNDRRNNVIGI
jgi:hypothetical protein